MDVGEMLGMEATDDGWRSATGCSKDKLPTLGHAAFASDPGDLGVEDVRVLGLQVSDRISDGVHVAPTRPDLRAVPKVDA